jgi:hypothetical protein
MTVVASRSHLVCSWIISPTIFPGNGSCGPIACMTVALSFYKTIRGARLCNPPQHRNL